MCRHVSMYLLVHGERNFLVGIMTLKKSWNKSRKERDLHSWGSKRGPAHLCGMNTGWEEARDLEGVRLLPASLEGVMVFELRNTKQMWRTPLTQYSGSKAGGSQVPVKKALGRQVKVTFIPSARKKGSGRGEKEKRGRERNSKGRKKQWKAAGVF